MATGGALAAVERYELYYWSDSQQKRKKMQDGSIAAVDLVAVFVDLWQAQVGLDDVVDDRCAGERGREHDKVRHERGWHLDLRRHSGMALNPNYVDLQTGDLKSSWAQLIRECGSARDLARGRRIHADILASGAYRSCVYLLNLVVEMYGKCGSVYEAKRAFDSIERKNQFSWNIVIAAFSANGAVQDALAAFEQAPFVDLVTRNIVLAAYARSGHLEKAEAFFLCKMPFHDVVSWSAMVTACGEAGDALGARYFFETMPERCRVSWNAMLTAVAMTGQIGESCVLFDQMPVRDLVSWTAMVQCCCVSGDLGLAIQYFERMPQYDAVVWNLMIQSHTRHGNLNAARDLIDAMPEPNAISWTIVVAGYARSGDLDGARMILGRIPDQIGDGSTTRRSNAAVAPWNAMIAALVERNRLEEALCLLEQMPVAPNAASWTLLLTSYFDSGHLHQAKRIFDAIPVKDAQAWTALLQGYSQLGHGYHTCKTFSTCPHKDAVTWSVAIGSLASNGLLVNAVELFHEMLCEGLNPSDGAFVAVMNSLAHVGLVKESQSQFRSMVMDVNRPTSVEHFSSMADLLGRAGETAASMELVSAMPFARDNVVDGMLLGAVSIHRAAVVDFTVH